MASSAHGRSSCLGHAKEARVAEARVPPPERGQAGGAEACGATPICCHKDAQANEAMKSVEHERPELKVEVAAGERETRERIEE